jgi:hypothetical protein
MTGGKGCQSEAAAVFTVHVHPLVGLIVVSGLGNEELISLDGIDKAVLVRDAPRPKTRKVMLQGLRLPRTFERLALDVIDQTHNSLGDFPIMRHPIREVFPSLVSKDNPHASSGSFRSVPPPAPS